MEKRLKSLSELKVLSTVPTYRTIATYSGTIVKVPKRSGFMNYKPAFTAISGASVSEHWQNGRALGQGVWLNLFFYKITHRHLGQKIVATVDVIEKSIGEKSYLMLNIHRMDDEETPQYEFAMPKDGSGEFRIDERVPETIAFRKREQRVSTGTTH